MTGRTRLSNYILSKDSIISHNISTNTSKSAFTLAEVLITLGIIGIVAALTLPSLIAKHQKQHTIAKLKKFYSVMSQAVTMSEIENGPVLQWEKPEFVANDYDYNGESTEQFFNKYLAPYLKYTKFIKGTAENQKYSKLILADGSSAYFHNGVCINIRYDCNGDKGPNLDGRDQFEFVICPWFKEKYTNSDQSFATFTYPSIESGGRDRVRQECATPGNHVCARLLELDNWEFKDDYPHNP